jgi:hypothetical protein
LKKVRTFQTNVSETSYPNIFSIFCFFTLPSSSNLMLLLVCTSSVW